MVRQGCSDLKHPHSCPCSSLLTPRSCRSSPHRPSLHTPPALPSQAPVRSSSPSLPPLWQSPLLPPLYPLPYCAPLPTRSSRPAHRHCRAPHLPSHHHPAQRWQALCCSTEALDSWHLHVPVWVFHRSTPRGSLPGVHLPDHGAHCSQTLSHRVRRVGDASDIDLVSAPARASCLCLYSMTPGSRAPGSTVPGSMLLGSRGGACHAR